MYFAEINGVRVGDAYLAPGWTSYNKTLKVQSYDVSALLKKGENVLAITVGEGWYKGALTWDKKRCFYGDDAAVCADLVLPDKTVSTDADWSARESFIRESGIFDGETIDLVAERRALTVKTVDFDKSA